MSTSITPTQAANATPVSHLSYQELDILHALRGFCAFYVVIFHAKYILWSGGRQYLQVYPRTTWGILDYTAFALDMLSSAGYEMVMFFFVLSGFFIRYAQLRKHRKPIKFYINRAVRIYPPYLFACLLASICLWFSSQNVAAILDYSNARELNITLAQAWLELCALDIVGAIRTLIFMPLKEVYIGYNDVYWSLLPEAIFYLIVPLAFWRAHYYYVVSILFHVLGAVWIQDILTDPISGYLLSFNFYFAVGAMLYDVVVQTSWLTLFRRLPKWILLSVTVVLFGVLLLAAVLKIKVVSGLIAVLLAVLSISVLLSGKISRDNVMVRLMHKVGIFSFSLYLYHFPLLLLCYTALVYFTGDLVFYARYYLLAVPLVTVVSYYLFTVTERPSVNYFRKV